MAKSGRLELEDNILRPL